MSTPPKPPPQTSTLKPNRLPAPTLFVGPPSRNASSTSLLPPQKDAPVRPPVARQHSLLGDGRKAKDRSDAPSPLLSPIDRGRPAAPLADSALLSPRAREAATKQREKDALKEAAEAKRVDAQWAEMQSTLSEVEASAQAAGAAIHAVFGPGHAKALEELRRAQVGLAQAWARSDVDDPESPTRRAKWHDGDDAEDADGAPKKDVAAAADLLNSDRLDKAGAGVPTVVVRDQRSNTATTMGTISSGKTALEEETENDIALARKRREANDRYFSRVNKGVLDVISKLEEVAKAMKSVEMESREIWGEGEGLDEG